MGAMVSIMESNGVCVFMDDGGSGGLVRENRSRGSFVHPDDCCRHLCTTGNKANPHHIFRLSHSFISITCHYFNVSLLLKITRCIRKRLFGSEEYAQTFIHSTFWIMYLEELTFLRG